MCMKRIPTDYAAFRCFEGVVLFSWLLKVQLVRAEDEGEKVGLSRSLDVGGCGGGRA